MVVLSSSSSLVYSSTFNFPNNYNAQLRLNPKNQIFFTSHRVLRPIEASISTANQESSLISDTNSKVPSSSMKLLFVEMGVGYDQHGQNVTSAAVRACRDAITSNSIPAFRRGSIPGVSFEQMKLQIKLGVPSLLHNSLDLEKVKSVFPYGEITNIEVVDGGLISSSGVHVEEMGDITDDCYVVNAAIYIGY